MQLLTEGVWKGDGEFDAVDLVLSFKAARYVKWAAAPVSDLAGAGDWLFSQHKQNRTRRTFVASAAMHAFPSGWHK